MVSPDVYIYIYSLGLRMWSSALQVIFLTEWFKMSINNHFHDIYIQYNTNSKLLSLYLAKFSVFWYSDSKYVKRMLDNPTTGYKYGYTSVNFPFCKVHNESLGVKVVTVANYHWWMAWISLHISYCTWLL
jgi:hypothetical protein